MNFIIQDRHWRYGPSWAFLVAGSVCTLAVTMLGSGSVPEP
jgi:hypothetical protein